MAPVDLWRLHRVIAEQQFLIRRRLPTKNHFCMFPRRMRPPPFARNEFSISHAVAAVASVAASIAASVVASVAVVVGVLLGGTGCDEFSARRHVQEGNKLYKDGQFEKACVEFEAGLKIKDLAIGHHNLGLCYSKLFSPGLKTPLNTERADKAGLHFQKYLETLPKGDRTANSIRAMMSKLWIDAGDYQRALDYWKALHETDATNRDIIGQLADIEFKAGNWEASTQWYMKDAELSTDPAGKVRSYQNVGNVCWAVLSNKDKVGDQRIRAADVGIAALQKAEAIQPKNGEVIGLMASIYNFRALAHGASWAAAIDRATSQTYAQRQRVLAEEAKKAQQAAPGAASPTPATAATKPGG